MPVTRLARPSGPITRSPTRTSRIGFSPPSAMRMRVSPVKQDLAWATLCTGWSRSKSTVAAALVWTLGQGLKDDFTPEVEGAWTAVYAILAETMKAAANTGA